ncbi:MAG: protease complex subunit PrcB family protein [Firmicutes bacterium]|nr:protease complex subunit PrcB family protein [Bacillota bacterium]
MSENNQRTRGQFFTKKKKRTLGIAGIAAVLGILAYMASGSGLIEVGGGRNVEFTRLAKEQIPQSIEADVIPEYRDLERALGCLVDGKVYVVVTRGEKPTAGYDLTIEKMKLQKQDGKTNLAVHALFTEPEPGIAVSQIITYPYVVAETDLERLPDTIELVVKYADGAAAQAA